MNRVEAFKCMTHPLLAIILIVGWIIFIGVGVDVPLAYETVAATVASTWAGKRTYMYVKNNKEKK